MENELTNPFNEKKIGGDMKAVNLANLMNKAFNGKYWHNEGDYCNRKHHPSSFPYRRYKRGKNRCYYCGAKIGKVKCVRTSNKQRLIDNMFSPSQFLPMMQTKT